MTADPINVVPVDGDYLINLKGLITCYEQGVDLNYTAFAMSSALPSLIAHVEKLTKALALAIAHDTQPYPTVEAYEMACATLEKHRQRADALAALLREANEAWQAADCDVQSGTRPKGCVCLGCRIYWALNDQGGTIEP